MSDARYPVPLVEEPAPQDNPLVKLAIQAPSHQKHRTVPDCLWPSDNQAGVPALRADREALALDLPVNVWGARVGRTRLTKLGGTLFFYTEDYRFEKLWKDPTPVVTGSVINCGEVNFSVYQQTPPAVAFYQTYRKRWLSRYWQECGLRIFVDLNVAPYYHDINLLGVPKGWRSYCTAGYVDRLTYTEQELAVAQRHAEGRPLIFVVYGGGKAVREWCLERAGLGVLWVPQDIDVRHGRELAKAGMAELEERVECRELES